MQIKNPSKKRIHDAAYGLCEMGIATRTDPTLWAESQEAALLAVPDHPRRTTTGAPIWSTREVQIAIKHYESNGGRYSMPSDPRSLLQDLVGALPDYGILGESKKVKKSESVFVLTKIVYLAPAWESGIVMCPHFGACGKFCIGHSTGRMQMDAQRQNRLAKTMLWHLYPDWFLFKVQAEAMNLIIEAAGKRMIPAIRMNGSSDVRWERHGLMQSIPAVTWYDYTKIPLIKRGENGKLPANYSLTFSLDEGLGAWKCATQYLQSGHNVAMVVGADWHHSDRQAKVAVEAVLKNGFIGGYPVLEGDETDARFLDARGHWILLHAKGNAAHDSEGFVYRFNRDGELTSPRLSLGLANRRPRRWR